MPTVTAYPFPALGRVLVEADWADTPAADCARVIRTVVATGATAPLRAIINPCTALGEYQQLSGGKAIFWDNEAPLDTPVTYTTDAFNSVPSQVLNETSFFDLFGRVVANGWGTATSGQVWTNASGPAAWFSTNGTIGQHAHAITATEAHSSLAVTGRNYDATVTATTSSIANLAEISIAERYIDPNNFVRVVFQANTGNLTIVQRTAGVNSTIGTLVAAVAATVGPVSIRFAVSGNVAKAKVWIPPNVEPDWTLTATILSPDSPSGGFALISYDETAAKTFTFANLQGSVNDGVTLTVTSSAVTLVSNGNLWLRDGMRPCNDLLIALCFSSDCDPVGGYSFVGEDQETYDANTTLMLPTNAQRPIPINRERRDAASTITFVSKLFTDRDALLKILDPGTPLIFSGPSKYGMPDRYMSIGAVTVGRTLTDQRRQKRVVQLPFTTVDRPVGTQAGTCEASFAKACTVYASWTAANAAGLTWTQIMYGKAGGVNNGFRQWNPGVENVFANWLAVENHGTWGALKTGA